MPLAPVTVSPPGPSTKSFDMLNAPGTPAAAIAPPFALIGPSPSMAPCCSVARPPLSVTLPPETRGESCNIQEPLLIRRFWKLT